MPRVTSAGTNGKRDHVAEQLTDGGGLILPAIKGGMRSLSQLDAFFIVSWSTLIIGMYRKTLTASARRRLLKSLDLSEFRFTFQAEGLTIEVVVCDAAKGSR